MQIWCTTRMAALERMELTVSESLKKARLKATAFALISHKKSKIEKVQHTLDYYSEKISAISNYVDAAKDTLTLR